MSISTPTLFPTPAHGSALVPATTSVPTPTPTPTSHTLPFAFIYTASAPGHMSSYISGYISGQPLIYMLLLYALGGRR